MIWILLSALGVPLWLCAVAISTIILRNRALRTRSGNLPVRVRRMGSRRWSPGHGVWIHDVFAFRGLPAAWKEVLVWATSGSMRAADKQEKKRLHRVGDDPVIVTLMLEGGATLELAARREHTAGLLGPFAAGQPSTALQPDSEASYVSSPSH